MEYITRCIDLIKEIDKMAVLIHSAFIGRPIVIREGSKVATFVEDIRKLSCKEVLHLIILSADSRRLWGCPA